jgi:hypothetical protein
VEDWAEIRRLHRAEGLPIKMIARTLGISRNAAQLASVPAVELAIPARFSQRPRA